MDANGADEITLEEYAAHQMATFNKQDTGFSGRVTAELKSPVIFRQITLQ